jgi:hypothetical protein
VAALFCVVVGESGVLEYLPTFRAFDTLKKTKGKPNICYDLSDKTSLTLASELVAAADWSLRTPKPLRASKSSSSSSPETLVTLRDCSKVLLRSGTGFPSFSRIWSIAG